jgi:hypothetical protein
MHNLNDFTYLKINKDWQRSRLQCATQERLYRQATGKLSVKCQICNQLANLFLRISKKFKESAQIKETDNLPHSAEQWKKMFNPPSDGIFI